MQVILKTKVNFSGNEFYCILLSTILLEKRMEFCNQNEFVSFILFCVCVCVLLKKRIIFNFGLKNMISGFRRISRFSGTRFLSRQSRGDCSNKIKRYFSIKRIQKSSFYLLKNHFLRKCITLQLVFSLTDLGYVALQGKYKT